MAVMYLLCENCKQVVARFDSARVKIPLKSQLFESHLAHRGVYPPWRPDLDPRWWKCPVCPKRVFNTVTPTSLYASVDRSGFPAEHMDLKQKVEEPEAIGGYICPGCGKEYSTRDHYDRYHKCPGKESVR